jgi:hypothetical protein
MATIDEQIAAAQARLAAKQAALGQVPTSIVSQPTPATPYSVGQGLFDVLVGGGKAFTGLTDIATYPVAKGAQLLGFNVPTFGLTKTLESRAQQAAANLGLRPETEAQKAIEFMTPIPGLSKGRVIADALLGLTAYSGSKAAEAVLPETALAPLVGAIAAPTVVQGAIGAAKGIGKTLAPSIGVIAGNEAALQAAAQKEVLNAIGKEGVEALQEYAPAALRVGAGDVPLTMAERVATPQVALYQNRVQQNPATANILVDALAAREAGVQSAIDKFATVPQQGVMADALREQAAAVAAAKVAKEEQALKALGLTPEAAATTPMQRGATVQQALMQEQAAALEVPRQAWKQVDKTIKLNATDPFDAALAQINKEFGPETRKEFGASTNERIARLETIVDKGRGKNRGLLTLADAQDLRSATIETAKKVGTQKPGESAEKKALQIILDAIDSDAVTVAKGDPTNVAKWEAARQATKAYKQKYREGVVGELLAYKGYKPKLETSQVVDRVLRLPENAGELLRKFGKDSVQVTELRMELLSRLALQKKPAEFILKNKDTFRQAFGAEYNKIVDYARTQMSKTGFEQYIKITDAAIPKAAFATPKTAKAFAKQFKDSPILNMARGKFIDQTIFKKGDPLQHMNENRDIAKELFGDRLPELDAILRDQAALRSPARLQKLVTRGQSQTYTTVMGALQSGRLALNKLAPALIGGTLGYGVGGPAEIAMGLALGTQQTLLREARNLQIDKYIAQILANPELLKLSAAPPTASNIQRFNEALMRSGIIGARADTDISETTGPQEGSNVNTELAAIQQRLAVKQMQLQQKGR